MFRVKNLAGGILSLDLENGGAINLANGQTVNLEVYCSREWIDTDPGFQSLIKRRVLLVVFDSATGGIPPANLTSAVPRQPVAINLPKRATQEAIAAAAASRARGVTHIRPVYPEAIPNIPKPTSDTEPMVIDLKTNAVSDPKKVVVKVDLKEPVKDGKLKVKESKQVKQHTEEELRKMYLGDIKIIAASLNIDVGQPVSKTKLITAILEAYKG